MGQLIQQAVRANEEISRCHNAELIRSIPSWTRGNLLNWLNSEHQVE